MKIPNKGDESILVMTLDQQTMNQTQVTLKGFRGKGGSTSTNSEDRSIKIPPYFVDEIDKTVKDIINGQKIAKIPRMGFSKFKLYAFDGNCNQEKV